MRHYKVSRANLGAFVAALLTTAPLPSLAFKIDTHVYVAQQVLNDVVDDGQISIAIGGVTHAFQIDPKLVSALRQYPSHFRMGSVGPDAFPGVLGGQVVIHPGDEAASGWGTGDWLHHIASAASRPDEVAFAAGFTVHAASDVFAHTYVNHYAGNVWDLSDETHVETRHFVLESYIASKNPPLLDHHGVPQGTAAQAIQDSSGRLAIPVEFVARTLIFSPVSKRFDGGAPHLGFLGRHERYIAESVTKAEDLAVEIERLVLLSNTGISLNSSEIRRLREFANRIRNALVPIDKLKEVIDEITKLRIRHAQIPADVLEKLLGELVKTYGRYAKARDDFEKQVLNVADIQDRINAIVSPCKSSKKLADAACKTQRKVCDWLGPLKDACKFVVDIDPICMAREQAIVRDAVAACDRIESAVKLRQLLEEAIKLRNKAEREALGLQDDLIAIANEIEKITVVAIQLESDLLKSGLDLIKLSLSDINAVVAFLKSWHEGIRRAGTSYVVANGQAMANAITPGGSPIEPLIAWLECHTLPIAGLPHPLNDAACSIGDAKAEVLGSLKRILERLGKVDPVAKAVLELVEDLERRIKAVAKETVVAALQEVTGFPVKELLRIIKEPGTAASMTRVFTIGEQYNLRSIPDAAYRVGADMSLATSNPYFDPAKFNVVYNAITLSKLSLLAPGQLNELAAKAGIVVPTSYGPSLFDGSSSKSSNVLVGAIRSIDGSFQWFDRGMPFLRTWSHAHPPLGRYSYLRRDDPRNGFRLWQDDQARDRIFRRVFHGPLVPGIDAPESIGFPPVLLPNYPYRLCVEHPWPAENRQDAPDKIVDTTCKPPALAPILEAFPDLTKENAESMLKIHELLAPINIDQTRLTSSTEWACVSATRDSKGLHTWSLRFAKDGRLTGQVAYRTEANPEKVAHAAAISATYKIVGDFVFTFPIGAGFIQPSSSSASEPTLLRRLTSHPQRYWIDVGSQAPLSLFNQDGTNISCIPQS